MKTPDEKEHALMRAASSLPDDAPPAAMFARMLVTYDAIRRAEDDEKPQEQAQVWGSVSQVAKHFGVTNGAVEKWVAPLIRSGAVRILKPRGGWLRYNIPDMEKAMTFEPLP